MDIDKMLDNADKAKKEERENPQPVKPRPLRPGDRVEIPCYYDLWMQGARYGTIKSIKGDEAKIRMDNKQVKRLVVVPWVGSLKRI